MLLKAITSCIVHFYNIHPPRMRHPLVARREMRIGSMNNASIFIEYLFQTSYFLILVLLLLCETL